MIGFLRRIINKIKTIEVKNTLMYGVEKFGVDFNEHVLFLINVFKNMQELI